ncbi:hypothetical protein HTIA_p2950 (plasmid) [Halorhabdus tiamatea SARL4B]|uniref:Uncharacterized protein n=1 Tax=Halorhabdus tiamatea SARL4B TaxID=1033806 RepID=S6CW69_9EURY|nr:hypothetical protein HTIA_p2950 [Halorhabdus tiamatea SARL4B]
MAFQGYCSDYTTGPDEILVKQFPGLLDLFLLHSAGDLLPRFQRS